VLTLARAPPKNDKRETTDTNEDLLSARQFGLRLALLKPAALPVTPPSDPPLSLLLLRCILCLVFVISFKLFIAWKCSLVASWCTLCVGTPGKFNRGVMVY